jgi:hypothetical protein
MGTIVESTLPWLSNLVYDFVNVSSLVTRITVLQDKDSSRLQTSKFCMTSFYVTSFIWQVHVCICNTFYMTSFRMTSFIYWCERVRKRCLSPPWENHDGQSHQILRLLWQVFFVDPYRRTKFVLWQFFLWQVHLFNRPFPLWVKFWSRYAWVTISSQLERASQN